MAHLVIAHECSNRTEADIVQQLLTANGLYAIVSADDSGGTQPYLNFLLGAKVLVEEEYLQQALEIIRETLSETAE